MADTGPFNLGLGRTRPSSQGLQYLQAADVNLSGFNQAFDALAGIGGIVQERQDKLAAFKQTSDIYDFQTRTTLSRQEAANASTPGDAEIGKRLNEAYTKEEEAFIASQPPDQQEAIRARLAPFRQDMVIGNAKTQFESDNTYYRDRLGKEGTEQQNRIAQDPTPQSVIDRKAEYFRHIDESSLPPEEKLSWKQKYDAVFSSTGASEVIQRRRYAAANPQERINFFLQRSDRAAVAAGKIDDAHIANMDVEFAARVQAATAAAEAAGKPVTFTSTFRTYDEQADARRRSEGGTKFAAARPGHSQHERGMAVDISGPGRDWLRSIDPATGKPHAEAFGLHFPVAGDEPHMEMIGGRQRAASAQSAPVGGLVPAIIQQESGGNPNAIGRDGEVGLMQVMPGTAATIAQQINDTSFPFGGSPAEIRAYMLQPGMSEKYGTYLINQHMRTYGGDTKAALIAYNGGEGAANEWLQSGRNDNVSARVRQASQYADEVMARMGGTQATQAQLQPYNPMTADLWANPAYASTPYDQREAIEADAVRFADQANAEAQQTRTAAMKADVNRVLTDIENGKGTQSAINEVQENWGYELDADDLHKMNQRLDEKNKEVNLLTAGQEKLQTNAPWSGTSDTDKDMANALYENGGGRTKLINGDEEYFANNILPFANHTGMIPPDAASDLMGMAGSGNFETSRNGLNFLQKLYEANPLAFANGVKDEDVRKMVMAWDQGRAVAPSESDLWNHIRGLDGDAATRQLWKQRDEEMDHIQDPKNEDANRLTADDVISELGGGELVDIGTIGAAGALLQQEVDEAVKEQYRMIGNGDYEQARTAATNLLGMRWGVTNIGGVSSFTKYPVEKFYPPREGDYRYIEEQARAAASEVRALQPGERVMVVPDEFTEDDYFAQQDYQRQPKLDPATGKAAPMPPMSYKIFVRGTDGVDRMMSRRWAPDPDAPELMARENIYKQLQQAEKQIDTFRRDPDFVIRGTVPESSRELMEDYEAEVKRAEELRKQLPARPDLPRQIDERRGFGRGSATVGTDRRGFGWWSR